MILARRDGEKGRVMQWSRDGSVRALLADAEPVDDGLVPREVAPLEVVEESSTLAYELQQPATGMVILAMCLEVLGQIHDAIRQERNLYFR
jgi:hypothetical protein